MGTYNTCFARPVLVVVFICYVLMFKAENTIAFSVNLYQRDSYGSPFYDPRLSQKEIIRRAISRSLNKSRMITPNGLITDLSVHSADYLMKIRLGTPSHDIIAVLDTGSDLTWTQCQPCTQCVPQNLPFFHPAASTSYAIVPCGPFKPCPSGSHSRCQADRFCHHIVRYNHQVYSKGLLSKETLRIDSTIPDQTVEIPNYIFGCGTDTAGSFGGIGSGVIGLGIGRQSMVTQLGTHAMQRFSYCLIRLRIQDRVSHIRFGQDALVEGPGTVTVPLELKFSSTKYFITLEAFTVHNTRIEFTGRSGSVEEGNIVITSGTTLVLLPRQFFDKIKHAVIENTHANPVPDPNETLELCYNNEYSLRLPRIVANFRGGDVTLNEYNAYIISNSAKCLAFGPNDKISVYGSLAQQNFIVGYDSRIGTISFKPYDCTNY